MAQGNRPDRVAEEVRHTLSELLARDVHDPGIGFITLTRVKVSPDLQLARVYYTTMGDEKQKAATKAALERAKPFLRRQIGSRIRLRRVPELMFHFDEGIGHQDRIERVLIELKEARDAQERQAGQDMQGGQDSQDTQDLPDAQKKPGSEE